MTNPAVMKTVAQAAGSFTEAAPGHRFNLYFPIWRNDWSSDNNAKKDAIEACTSIPKEVGTILDRLRNRQQVLFTMYPDAMCIPTVSTAPFATGLGNEHPVENGFSFLTPYGLPYLAGAGVKGVLRRAAEELALFADEYVGDGTHTETTISMLDVWWLFGFEGAAGAVWPLTRKEERKLSDEKKVRRARFKEKFDAHLRTLVARQDLRDFIIRAYPKAKEHDPLLANPETFLNELNERRQNIHTRGALTFWDVFPKSPTSGPYKDKLAVEIMTPHYGDYYQAKKSAAYPSGVTPHDAGQPNPIPFLAVPAGSRYDFYIICDQSYLSESLRPRWKFLLGRIFTHAFDWLGFGAKTAVGYGAMKRDEAREEEYRKEREERARQTTEAAEAKRKEGERQARLAALDPLEREIEEVLAGRPDKNQTEESCLINAVKQGRWSGNAKCRVAEKLRNMMQQSKLWKEKSQAKKPDKDRDYQNTLLVKSWLSGD